MTTQNVRIALVAVALTGAAGAAAGQIREIVRTIPMDPGGRLTLRNVEGEITVTGVDGRDLTIRATKRAAGRGTADDDALDRVEIEIEERGDRVIVETDYPRHRRSFLESLASLFDGGRRDRREPLAAVDHVAVDYLVTMPRDADVTIESFAGAVTVEGVDGETRVEVISGDVRLASLARLVAVESFSGDLELTDVRSDGALAARTVSGRIDIERVRAPRLEVQSFSGAVALEGVQSRRVEVETVSGPVTFDGSLESDGRYGVRSHSGRIVLTVPDGSAFELEAESFSGGLRSDVPLLAGPGGAVRQATILGRGYRAIRGTAGGGAGARLALSTVSGDIVISDGKEGTEVGEEIPRAPQGLPSLPGLSLPEPPMPPPPPPPPPPVQETGG